MPYCQDWAVDFCGYGGYGGYFFPAPSRYTWENEAEMFTRQTGRPPLGAITVWVFWILKLNIYFPGNCKNAQFAYLFYSLGWLRIWFQIIHDVLNYIAIAMMQEFLDLLVILSKLSGASNALVNIPKVNIQIIWVPNGWCFLSAGVVMGEGGVTRGVYCY